MWSIPQSSSNFKQHCPKYAVVFCYAAAYLLTSRFEMGCIWKKVIGLPCPGCGYSRALLAAAKLDFVAAWQFHPLFWLFPLLILLFIKDGRIFQLEKANRILVILIALLFAIVWVIRLSTGTLPS